MDKRKGEIKLFRRNFFVTQCRKNFVGESFFVALIPGIAEVWTRRGGEEYPDFLSKVFRLTVPKISVRESFVALISGTEKLWRRGGGE